MAWKIGDEFISDRGGFFPVKIGSGTHIWNGKMIVPKPKKKRKVRKMYTLEEAAQGDCRDMFLDGYDEERDEDEDEREPD